MAQTTPLVRFNTLYADGSAKTPLCRVESPHWFAWLATATAFRYQTSHCLPITPHYARPLRPISLRKEKRRQGYLWYAYLRRYGRLCKCYAGRSPALTLARLDELAAWLNTCD